MKQIKGAKGLHLKCLTHYSGIYVVQLTTAITFYFNAYIANTKCDNQIICRGQGMRRGFQRRTHPGREEADAWLKNYSHSVGLGKRKTIADFRERKWQYKLLASTGKKKKKKRSQFSCTELEKPYFVLCIKALWSTIQTTWGGAKHKIVAMIPLTKRVDLQCAIRLALQECSTAKPSDEASPSLLRQ